MQDKIILGLLCFHDLTAYDIKKAMDGSTGFFYKASMGSIHPALKKLEKAGFATVRAVTQNGRAKKVYRITETGREHYQSWLGQGLALPDTKDESLVRLFFFGHLPKAERAAQIARFTARLDETIATLESLQTHIATLDPPPEMADHHYFQSATLDYGIQFYRFTRDWFANITP